MSSLIRARYFPMHLLHVKCLRYFGGTNKLEIDKVTHARWIVANQCFGDNMLKTNAQIAFYSNCAAIGSAPGGYNQINKCSALNSGHLVKEFALDALRLLNSEWISERDESRQLNASVSAVLLTSCTIVEDGLYGRQCHGFLLKSGLVFHQYVKTALIHLYCMLSDVVGAMEVLVSGPGDKALLDDAFNINKRKMMADDMLWNKTTYVGIFDLCARLKYYELGRQVHNKLLKSDVEFDVSVCNAMLKMYRRCGDLANALILLRTSKARDVVSWTTMITAFSDYGYFEQSLKLFLQMQRDNVAPNESTFPIILDASAELFYMRFAHSFHALAEKTGFQGHKKVEDALISVYGRTGDYKAAEKVFLGMPTYHRDIITWNMMVCGYYAHGFGKKALASFEEMLKSGENPTYETFVGVLEACGQLGLVKEGFYYLYELMKEKGVEPGLLHYRIVMQMLIKAGRLDEAFDFKVSTPLKSDFTASMDLLIAPHADRDHMINRFTESLPDGFLELGMKASEFFGVKEMIQVNDYINAQPAPSWVEVKKQTHKFVLLVHGDPEFDEVHKIIKPLFASIKAYEMKGDCDGYHSEQLAVAYALLNTPEGAPIRILKKSGKGKICDDCHSLMKLISKARKRLITVIDVGVYHHFQDGSCSCGDYW